MVININILVNLNAMFLNLCLYSINVLYINIISELECQCIYNLYIYIYIYIYILYFIVHFSPSHDMYRAL